MNGHFIFARKDGQLMLLERLTDTEARRAIERLTLAGWAITVAS
jgi:hypothetical protein